MTTPRSLHRHPTTTIPGTNISPTGGGGNADAVELSRDCRNGYPRGPATFCACAMRRAPPRDRAGKILAFTIQSTVTHAMRYRLRTRLAATNSPRRERRANLITHSRRFSFRNQDSSSWGRENVVGRRQQINPSIRVPTPTSPMSRTILDPTWCAQPPIAVLVQRVCNRDRAVPTSYPHSRP
jgi:hypothetical protein